VSAPSAKKPDGINYQKPRNNVYVMMLILSFFAIVTACVVLYLELSTYGDWPQWDVTKAMGSSAQLLAPSTWQTWSSHIG